MNKNTIGNSVRLQRLFMSAILTGTAMVGCTDTSKTAKTSPDSSTAPITTELNTAVIETSTSEQLGTASTTETKSHFSGGCAKFIIYAQNLHEPNGAGIKTEPSPLAARIEPGYQGDEAIAVDGWVEGDQAPYPDNPHPYDSKVYFHIAYPVGAPPQDGWVSFAGTRAYTSVDAKHLPETPAPTDPGCEGVYTP